MDVIDGPWIEGRLKGARGEKARLARHVGWDAAKLAKVLKGGRKVQATEIPLVLEFFENEREGASDLPADGEEFTLVPGFNVEASAGPGLIAPEDENAAYQLQLPRDYLRGLTESHPRHLKVISVKGTSMLPTLKPGDIIMVVTAKTSPTYDGLFVLDIDGAVLVKRIGRSDRAGWVRIKSDNPQDDPFERRIEEVRVVGKVIWRGVKE